LPLAEVWRNADPLSDYIKLHNPRHWHWSPTPAAGC